MMPASTRTSSNARDAQRKLVPYVLHGRREGAEVAAPALRVPVGDREVVLAVEEPSRTRRSSGSSARRFNNGPVLLGRPPSRQAERRAQEPIHVPLTVCVSSGSPLVLARREMAAREPKLVCNESQKCRNDALLFSRVTSGVFSRDFALWASG